MSSLPLSIRIASQQRSNRHQAAHFEVYKVLNMRLGERVTIARHIRETTMNSANE